MYISIEETNHHQLNNMSFFGPFGSAIHAWCRGKHRCWWVRAELPFPFPFPPRIKKLHLMQYWYSIFTLANALFSSLSLFIVVKYFLLYKDYFIVLTLSTLYVPFTLPKNSVFTVICALCLKISCALCLNISNGFNRKVNCKFRIFRNKSVKYLTVNFSFAFYFQLSLVKANQNSQLTLFHLKVSGAGVGSLDPYVKAANSPK